MNNSSLTSEPGAAEQTNCVAGSPVQVPSIVTSPPPATDGQTQEQTQPDQAPESKSVWTQKPRPWWPQLRRGPFLGGVGRITGLDAARGIALLGMVIAHAAAVDESGNTPRWLGFAHGRASILFAMVAGISLAIITGGTKPRDGEALLRDRLRIFTRAVVLLVLGSILETLGTPILIILGSYALWFVLALPFVRCSVRTLLLWGLGFALLGSSAIFLVEEFAAGNGYYPGGSPGNSLLTLLFVSTYPAVVWMGFVLVGMAIGRSNLANPKVLLSYGLSGLLLFAAFAAPFVIQEGIDPLFQVTPDRGPAGPSIQGPDSSMPLPSLPLPDESESDPVLPEDDAAIEPIFPKDGPLPLPLPLDEKGLSLDQGISSDFICMENGQLYPCNAAEWEQQTATWTDKDWAKYSQLASPELPNQGPQMSVGKWFVSRVFTLDPHTGSPFEALSSGGFAMAVIAGCVALGRRFKYALAPLSAVGSMSLTAYTIHVATTAALGLSGPGETNAPMIWQLVGLSVFALVWAWFFKRGPLEQAMASWADRGSSVPRSRS